MEYHNVIQGTAEWLATRYQYITGTMASGLSGTPKALEAMKYEVTANTLYVPRDDLKYLSPMARGKYLEPEARTAFKLATGLAVWELGMLSEGRSAFSPDGVSSACPLDDITYSVEIKCVEEKTYIQYIYEKGVPEKYVAQCNRPFIVCPTIQIVYFVVYNPEIPLCPLYIYEYTRAEATATEDYAKQIENEPKVWEAVTPVLAEIERMAKLPAY